MHIPSVVRVFLIAVASLGPRIGSRGLYPAMLNADSRPGWLKRLMTPVVKVAVSDSQVELTDPRNSQIQITIPIAAGIPRVDSLVRQVQIEAIQRCVARVHIDPNTNPHTRDVPLNETNLIKRHRGKRELLCYDSGIVPYLRGTYHVDVKTLRRDGVMAKSLPWFGPSPSPEDLAQKKQRIANMCSVVLAVRRTVVAMTINGGWARHKCP